MCDSKELLVGFLYNELDAGERRTFETHLLSCAECRDELTGLRATRGQLARWAPPEPDLAFTIVRGGSVPAAAARFRVSPAWGLAAAALLVMGISAAIAHVEIRYGAEGLVMRTGWNHGAAATVPQPASPAPAAIATPVEWTGRIQVLDDRLRQLEGTMSTRAQTASAGQRMSDADMLRQIRDMLAASESRQQRALAKVSRDVNTQRQIDLAAISQGMTRIQAASDAEVKQYRDLILRTYRNTAYQQNASQK